MLRAVALTWWQDEKKRGARQAETRETACRNVRDVVVEVVRTVKIISKGVDFFVLHG